MPCPSDLLCQYYWRNRKIFTLAGCSKNKIYLKTVALRIAKQTLTARKRLFDGNVINVLILNEAANSFEQLVKRTYLVVPKFAVTDKNRLNAY
jgi:hypothetical protein